MTVYIDDMYLRPAGKFGWMKMSHMVADTEAELHAMADAIGVKRKWYQGDHYDVSLRKRGEAIRKGAVPITQRQLGIMTIIRRATPNQPYPTPEDADLQWAGRIAAAAARHKGELERSFAQEYPAEGEGPS